MIFKDIMDDPRRSFPHPVDVDRITDTSYSVAVPNKQPIKVILAKGGPTGYMIVIKMEASQKTLSVPRDQGTYPSLGHRLANLIYKFADEQAATAWQPKKWEREVAPPALVPNAKFPEVIDGLISAFKADHRFKIKSIQRDVLTLDVPGLNNPEVDSVVFTGLSKERAAFRIVMKDGTSGWDWDAYRDPPQFLDKDNVFLPAVVAKDLGDLPSFMEGLILNIEVGVRDVGRIYDKVTDRLYYRTEWEALVKKRKQDELALRQQEADRAKAEEQRQNSPAARMEEIESFLRSMRYMGGRANRVDSYDTGFSVDTSNRERLDHYVGSNYYPDEEEGDDPEGWDSDGWEEEYAGPMREDVQTKLDARFGKGVCDVDIGEKGHVDIEVNMAKLKGAKMAHRVAARYVARCAAMTWKLPKPTNPEMFSKFRQHAENLLDELREGFDRSAEEIETRPYNSLKTQGMAYAINYLEKALVALD